LSISDIRRKNSGYQYKRTVIVYLCFSILTFAIDKIYALFGHGVSSEAMTWMFLYPLLGGGLFYLLLGLLFPEINSFSGYRLFYNLYNSGIALLTAGSLLKGILEIAGTGSSYLKFYYILGFVMMGIGAFLVLMMAVKHIKLNTKKD
jgi:hypothetical protein